MKFGPDDHSTLDNEKVKEISDGAKKIKDNLLRQYKELEKMRYGDAGEHVPVSRADGLWPFLLIRSYRGDIGARPIPFGQNYSRHSPDIILASGNPQYQRTIVGRDDIGDFLAQNAILNRLPIPLEVAVWVHVWNLGRAPAHGVRVRAWLSLGSPLQTFIGGRAFDLGDRTSLTSHLLVKVGTFVVPANFDLLAVKATAECMSDVASAVRDPVRDRHTALANFAR